MNKVEKDVTCGRSGGSLLLYLLLIVPLYWGVMLLHGQLSETDARDAWNRVAAPWLGDAPTGIGAADYEPLHPEQFAYRVFIIPPGGDWKARIISVFDMQGEYAGEDEEKRRVLRKTLGYKGAFRVYDMGGAQRCVREILPEENRQVCYSPSLMSPYLLELPDGRLVFCADDVNAEKDSANAVTLSPPHPQYLSAFPTWRLLCRASLGVGVFLFPALFCCIGCLWVQRRRLRDASTLCICLVLPPLAALAVEMAALYLNNNPHEPLAVFGHIFFNLVAACGLVLLTFVVRCTCRIFRLVGRSHV